MAVPMVFRYVMHMYRAIAPLAYLGFVKKNTVTEIGEARHTTAEVGFQIVRVKLHNGYKVHILLYS